MIYGRKIMNKELKKDEEVVVTCLKVHPVFNRDRKVSLLAQVSI
jgi:hypothetical protein